MPRTKEELLRDINALEKAETDLLTVTVLKKEIKKLFIDYKKSRMGLITFLFRDRELTKEKLEIVDKTIKFIDDFEGSPEKFVAGLRLLRARHADKSREHEKIHYNLMETRAQKNDKGRLVITIKQGESNHASGLAKLFHEAIDRFERAKVATISNSLK